ncbi:holin [Gordonia sp. PDNC005]|uniref:holin n=1 Tax=Gordonia sp. PDNC005 TaxID=2811424 RepID=UPI0019656A34|nr:holin [Gordonia sp. PDNC005]QRY62769.1 holin [Gordonia sp. PDNC005]
MWTARFWRDAVERAVKTGAQALVALFVTGATILTINWADALAVAGTMMLASLLTSIVSSGIGNPTTAAALPAPPGRHRKSGE